MHNEQPNPFAQESQDEPQQKQPSRTPLRCAVRTMLTTIAIMGAVFVVMSGVLSIETMIKREPMEDFWAVLGDEPWIPLMFVSSLPAIASSRDGRGCCCISRLIRRKKTAHGTGSAASNTPGT